MSESVEVSLIGPLQFPTKIQTFDDQITAYLEHVGLPTENVLIGCGERRRVINNLPEVLASLPSGSRARAHYISKFSAACSVGLFDAALNFLWNETVTRLRERVANFDLDYFLETAVSDPKRRETFRAPSDLAKLDDWELIRGCLETGLITEIGYKHLDYIRDIRNYASAAHPNQNELSGLQVATFLETCIREVLSKEPAGPVLSLQSLLKNRGFRSLCGLDIAPNPHNERGWHA